MLIYCQFFFGMSFSKSCEIFLRSVLSERSKRRAKRFTCVSVGIPGQSLKSSPRTTCAVLYPTPGSDCNCSAVRGTLPPKSREMIFAVAIICFALFLKIGMDDISRSNTRGVALAKQDGFLYFLKSCSVTRFTTLSVHCAESITATAN